ncbi:MAG: cupin domain-containing protein [Gammaproteobacteria bacterium]|nr:cupin domain-containing protein [Gammaproteobacteria bacterium]
MKSSLVTKSLITTLLIFSSFAWADDGAFSRTANDEDIAWGPCPAFFPTGCELAAIQGDPAKPNSDIYFKIPGGYVFPAHWHTSAERMVLVSGELDVTYQGQNTTHLKTGMYAYGPAKAVHDGKCISKESCILTIAFEAPVDAYKAE